LPSDLDGGGNLERLAQVRLEAAPILGRDDGVHSQLRGAAYCRGHRARQGPSAARRSSLYSPVQAKKVRERATRRAQAASVHVACAASCSLPFELPLCPLLGTPPALRVWSPLPSALLFWVPRSEKACLAAARKDLNESACQFMGRLRWVGGKRERTFAAPPGGGGPGAANQKLVPAFEFCVPFRVEFVGVPRGSRWG